MIDAKHCYDGKPHRWVVIRQFGFTDTKWCKRCGSIADWEEGKFCDDSLEIPRVAILGGENDL